MPNFEEKANELAKESLQKAVPEAVASVSYTATTPAGFSIILTLRDRKESDLFERMNAIENFLVDAGYTAGYSSNKNVSKSTTRAPSTTGSKCPECGNDLVERQGKYGPFWGCSTYPVCTYIKK